MYGSDLLDLWDAGEGCAAIERGLLVASQAAPTSADDAVGLRNARILEWRSRQFGARVEALAACPDCGEIAEFTLPDMSATEPMPGTLSMGDWEVEYRPANSLDLAYMLRFDNDEDAASALVRRCVLACRRSGEEASFEEVPKEVLEALDERLDAEDPLGAPRLSLACPKCETEWEALIDLPAITWREIGQRARRTLSEVHDLAKAYGWNETEILALSPARRRRYLEFARS
ncbi:MAG: hypothetical protein KF784_00465 [Fimbriimonadaceae bacterium]|nr:hypothetical protein [Fimbriimonadaceae bacterium]